MAIFCWMIFMPVPDLLAQSAKTKDDPRITLRMKEVSLPEVLSEIERQAGVTFSYESSLLKELPKISFQVKDETLTDCLTRLFESYPIVYKVSGKIVILKRRQRQVTISGFVRDQASSESLIGASVYEVASRKGSATNSYGFFSLTLPPGNIRLHASYIGYESCSFNFTELDRDTILNIELRPNARLEEVVVTASERDRLSVNNTLMGTMEFSQKTIKATPTLFGESDIVKTLQLTPGVASGTEGLAGLYVRGGDQGTSYFLSFVCLCIILLITLLLIRWMNGINRKIATFFESVRNGDTALRYPNKTNDPFVKDLYTEMNRIILLFSQNQSEMEEKRLYYESILRVLTHEIRNSITPIRSLSADLLKYSDTYTPKQLREGLEVIHGQAQNLSAFLDSYHRLTHLPEPERTEVPITSLFQKMERLLCAEPGSDRIRFSSAEALTVRVDQNLIVLALINLIRNALQAIEGQADGIVSVEALKTDGRVYITITDNGPGISPELLSAIFTPFFSTKSGGSGIGLSISHRIMRLHGGDLTVDSLPGVRTEFRMKL